MLKEYNLHHMQKTECYLPFTLLLLHKAQSDQQKKEEQEICWQKHAITTGKAQNTAHFLD